MSAAQNMEVEVIDRLPAEFAAIGDDAVARVGDAKFARDLTDNHPEVAEQSGVILPDGVDRPDFLFWNHQDMDGRLRCDVAKGKAEVVFIDDVGGNLTVDDSLEDRAHGFLSDVASRGVESLRSKLSETPPDQSLRPAASPGSRQ